MSSAKVSTKRPARKSSGADRNAAPGAITDEPVPKPPTETEDDEDCILIPQEIETIDLCDINQQQIFRFLHPVADNEVIEIQDSPVVKAAAIASSKKPLVDVKAQLSFNDSLSAPKKLEIPCPVCLECVIKRDPVSTACGHVFCGKCLEAALKVVKKCPMCKRALGAKGSFHNIFLGE